VLEGGHVPVEQLAVTRPVRLRQQVLVRRHLVESGTRALEAAFHRRRRGPEQGGHLVRPPGQHIPEDEYDPLPRRQVLQRRDEREPQAAARRDHGRRVDERVGHRLEPRDVRRRGPGRLLGRV
jgi:hypothetical protein